MNALLIGLLALAVGLAMIRLLRGPTDADRVVAFDLLSACGIAACALAAAITGRVLYLDVALGVAVVAFVGTLAWARAVEKRGGRRG
ncbi:monovalent cation/H+ antiporter complex subunit F [Myxococcota bacterium]|nr:monovalent cation/H+ antiporter complex subunit F [Myxococcota bacterium]